MRHVDRPSFEESVHVDAPPARVWPVISDIAFPVGYSEELQYVRWESGDDGHPGIGRRFVGRNANEHFGEWDTVSTVTECDPPRVFGWAVGDPDEPNTSWRFTLEPDADGTLLTQWGRLGYGPSGLHIAIERMPELEERIVARRIEQFRAAMRANLAAAKRAAEG